MIKHIKECQELELEAVFDPGQQLTVFSEIELKKMISQAKFVIGNDYEIRLLQQKTGWDMHEMLNNCEVVITTLGSKGSVVSTQNEIIEISACPVTSADDPTGAGDAYRAGFFAGYLMGKDWKSCGQIGSVAAAYAVEVYGTQIDFKQKEFEDRYKSVYGDKITIKA